MSKAAAIQEAGRKSLTKLLRLVSALAFHCGLSISEVNILLRKAAVQSAAARQLESGDRVNISGIAASTGIPRGEVSRILNSGEKPTFGAMQGRPSTVRTVLSAWQCDPEYLTGDRRPRNLKIFGAGSTFESLVRTYGQGLPVRAVFDELKRIGAIQFTTSQEVVPKIPLVIHSRLTRKSINDIEATTEIFLRLLSTSGAASKRVSGNKAQFVAKGCPKDRRRNLHRN